MNILVNDIDGNWQIVCTMTQRKLEDGSEIVVGALLPKAYKDFQEAYAALQRQLGEVSF